MKTTIKLNHTILEITPKKRVRIWNTGNVQIVDESVSSKPITIEDSDLADIISIRHAIKEN